MRALRSCVLLPMVRSSNSVCIIDWCGGFGGMGVGPFYVVGWVIDKIYAYIKKICHKGLDRLGLGGLLCPEIVIIIMAIVLVVKIIKKR